MIQSMILLIILFFVTSNHLKKPDKNHKYYNLHNNFQKITFDISKICIIILSILGIIVAIQIYF